MFSIKLRTKKSIGAYVFLSQEWSWAAAKITIFEIQGDPFKTQPCVCPTLQNQLSHSYNTKLSRNGVIRMRNKANVLMSTFTFLSGVQRLLLWWKYIMVFNHKWRIFILTAQIYKQLFEEVQNQFMVKLSTLQQAQCCLKFILHSLEKVFANVSFKNKTSLWLKTMTHSNYNNTH